MKTLKRFEVLPSSLIDYSYFSNSLSILDDNSLIKQFYITTAIHYMNRIAYIAHMYKAITTDERNKCIF